MACRSASVNHRIVIPGESSVRGRRATPPVV
jgi:hypothetical protein